MDVEALFEILAGYLGFFIDTLMLKGMDKFARSGEINPVLVSYFVSGVFVAYLISSARKIPGYEEVLAEDQDEKASQETTDTEPHSKQPLKDSKEVNTSDMASFVLLSIVGGLVFHGFLITYNKFVGKIEIGSVKDTLNAIFAYNAIYHPLNAFVQQLGKGAKVIGRAGRGCALLAMIVLFSIAVFYFGGIIYLLYPLAAVHGTTMTYMLGPSLFLIATFFVFMALLARIARVPLSSLLLRRSSSNDRAGEKSPNKQSE